MSVVEQLSSSGFWRGSWARLIRTRLPTTLGPGRQQTGFNCSGHFQRPPRGSLGPQETTKQYYTRKNTQQSLKERFVSVGHPVGVGAPGTGVAPKIAPTRPLGFPTGT